MAYLHTIPTKAAVDRAWDRYCALQLAVQTDPHARDDHNLQLGLMRAHEQFCTLYNEWAER